MGKLSGFDFAVEIDPNERICFYNEIVNNELPFWSTNSDHPSFVFTTSNVTYQGWEDLIYFFNEFVFEQECFTYSKFYSVYISTVPIYVYFFSHHAFFR